MLFFAQTSFGEDNSKLGDGESSLKIKINRVTDSQ
jgi:hypothetical protein